MSEILGLHHITLISADAQRTADFYTRVLGLRLIKKTVNFDDPGSYHIYFGDEVGSVGTAITFFEWPDAPKGFPGIGGTHHLALRTPNYDGLLKWKRRLTDLGVKVNGPYNRLYFQSIYFKDPDGVILEIATDGPGFDMDEAPDALGTEIRQPPAEMTAANRDEETISKLMWESPVETVTADMALLKGMHHISAIGSNIRATDAFYSDVLGMRRIKMQANFDDPDSAHWYWANKDAEVGSVITYFERSLQNTRHAQMGTGLTHHFAFAVADEDVQKYYQRKLSSAGYRVSQIMDRDYFKSIYTHDPDGHIVELATVGPGFLIDEPVETLGTELQLPDWLENRREYAEKSLQPITIEPWRKPEVEEIS